MLRLCSIGIVSIFIIMSGCTKKTMLKQEKQVNSPVVTETKEDSEEVSTRFSDWQGISELGTVHYEFDRYDMNPRETIILQKNAEYLKAHPEFNIIVEGHTDERGTNEYNMGLGQKRADVVRDYYTKLGISLSRIATISYGEENPLDKNHTENASAKNRRAETKVRNK